MARPRYQRGHVAAVNGCWRGYWYATTFDSASVQKRIHRSTVLGSQATLTKTEAKRRLAEIIAEQQGVTPDNSVTLGIFIRQKWLPVMKAHWKLSTLGTNLGILENQILKPLGTIPLTDFDKTRLQIHVNQLAETYSYSVVQHTVSFLKSIFEETVEADFLPKNPARSLHIPRITGQRGAVGYGQQFFLDGKPYLTCEQLRSLLSVLEGRERLLVMLTSLMALRVGEALGLDWSCYTGDDLIVLRRVYRGRLDSTKTPASAATLPVPKIIMEVLDNLKSSLTPREKEGFIFSSSNGTPLNAGNFLRRVLYPSGTLAEIPFTLNWQVLRRTWATLAVNFGASYAEIEAVLRHASGDIHLAYVQAQRERILDLLNRMCEKVAGGLSETYEVSIEGESSQQKSQDLGVTSQVVCFQV
jgi:integrase